MSIRAVQAAVFGLLAVAVVVLVFAVGYVVGDRGESSSVAPGSPDAAVDTNQGDDPVDTDFANLNEIFEILEDKYVDPDIIDRQTQYQQAINGMLETFPDSGTFYVDPQTVATSVGPSGKFEGIGATVASQNGDIVIVAPIEDTPAERAGILPGDVILEVDGESTEGWTQEKAVLKIRGPAGTTVALKIRHAESGEEETLEIERDEIKVKSVTTQPPGGSLKDGAGTDVTDIAYIYLREFTEPSREEMQIALQDAIDSGKKGLILDLRNNPGGLLRTTIDIADEFLDGDKVILTERDREGTEQVYKSKDGGIALDIPVVILMNRFSASGSEVLAAALQDNARAQLVGEKSFGKGTVNVSNDLDDGGQLYVSVAKWLTPNGVQIDGVGIRPDIGIQLNDEDIDLRRDVQLWKAIDLLRGTDFTPPRTPAAGGAAPPGPPPPPGGGWVRVWGRPKRCARPAPWGAPPITRPPPPRPGRPPPPRPRRPARAADGSACGSAQSSARACATLAPVWPRSSRSPRTVRRSTTTRFSRRLKQASASPARRSSRSVRTAPASGRRMPVRRTARCGCLARTLPSTPRGATRTTSPCALAACCCTGSR